MGFWEVLAQVVIATGTLSSVIGYLIKRQLQEKQHAMEIELENIRNENQDFREKVSIALSIEVERSKAAFSEIYRKRLEVLGKSHELLLKQKEALLQYIMNVDIAKDYDESRYKQYSEVQEIFDAYFNLNRIYVTEAIDRRIDRLKNRMKLESIRLILKTKRYEAPEGEDADKWAKYNTINDIMDPALDLLRSEMRDIIDPQNRLIDAIFKRER